MVSQKQKYVFATEMGDQRDPMNFRGITKVHTETGVRINFKVESYQIVGEAVFVPRGTQFAEDDSLLLVPGYDENRDESFLVIVDSQDMREKSKIWLGAYLPLGFHGNFYPRPN